MNAIDMIARCMKQSEPWNVQGDEGRETPEDSQYIYQKLTERPIPEEPMGNGL